MNYAAVCAKIKAMSAHTTNELLPLNRIYTRIKPFIFEKSLRDYIELLFGLPEKPGDEQLTGLPSHFLLIWKKQNQLDMVNRKIMNRIVGTQIDLMNILWMHRLKHYYNIVGERTYGFLVPVHHRLTPAVIKEMADSKDSPSLLGIVTASAYREVFRDFSYPEQGISREIAREYAKASRAHPNSLATICGFLFEKERELKNTKIAHMRESYGLPAEAHTELF